MTIPFLKPSEPISTRRFANYAFRLYWPFVLVTCGLWLIVTVTEQAPLHDRMTQLLLALYSGNANLLKQVTHMGLLWFLPSFITVVALRNLIDTKSLIVRRFVLFALAMIHVVIGAVALAIENFLPLGLLPALYMVPLALIAARIHQRWLEPLKTSTAIALTLAAFIAVKALQMHWSLANEVGFSAVADWRDPQALLVNDLEAITGTLMLFQVARLKLGKLLDACGKYSMQMYLFHAFIALIIYKIILRTVPDVPVVALFSASLAATIGITLAWATFVMRVDFLRRMIFPREPAELPRP